MQQHVDDVLAMASREICHFLNIKLQPVEVFPDTLQEVIAFYDRFGAIAVGGTWSGDRWMGDLASAQAFEGWHDHSHISCDGSFDMAGEERVNQLQQAQLMQWWKRSKSPVTAASIKRASATLDMHNLGRLQHWNMWGGPPEHARSFAQGYLTALGLADKPPHCHVRGIPASFEPQYPREARP